MIPKQFLLLIAFLCLISVPKASAQNDTKGTYLDTSLSIHERVTDLISRLTFDEEISLLTATSDGIPRLGIGKYYHGNEALHGVVRPGNHTVFPQAIALSAMWNPAFLHEIATAISDEARAQWNSLDHGKLQKNQFSDLLTFWSPTVNMARDPRWGRCPETYGEDPFLSGVTGEQFVKGLQGNDPRYLKVVSTPKHFVANNEENIRMHCMATISEKQLREYYLPAFERCIREGHAQAIMAAYNGINNVPCHANPWLLRKVLREDWGFNGYVVTDCGGLGNLVEDHKFVKEFMTAATIGMKVGIDLECGDYVYRDPLREAYEKCMVSKAEIDSAAYHVLRARMKLGMFDPIGMNPYDNIPASVIGCEKHTNLALEAARQALVLLKNDKGMLPLNLKKMKKIAVVGINTDKCEFGDYSGSPVVTPVSILDGIRQRVGNDAQINFVPWVTAKEQENVDASAYKGNLKEDHSKQDVSVDTKGADENYLNAASLEAVGNSDVAIVVLGSNMSIEREGLDRESINLQPEQEEFIKKAYELNKNIVLILSAGSSLAVNWENEHIPAILNAWYDGQATGTAVAEALFGDYNPGGRLPLTYYKSMDDLPDMHDYDIAKGRTYQYFKGTPLYPFGFGLSYTTFKYADCKTAIDNDSIKVRFSLKNTGSRAGDEVAQVYVTYLDGGAEASYPLKQLKGFARVNLKKGEKKTVEIGVARKDIRFWDEQQKTFVTPTGRYRFQVGPSSATAACTTVITL